MIGNIGFSCLASLEMGELAVLKVVKDTRWHVSRLSPDCHFAREAWTSDQFL